MTGNGDFSIGSPVWTGTSKLIEEMGELNQVLGKLMGSRGDALSHWSGTDLRAKLVEEIGDVMAAILFFRGMNMTPEESLLIEERVLQKWQLFQKWHDEQPPNKKPEQVVNLSCRVAELQNAVIHVTEKGWRCVLCEAFVESEDGTDQIEHHSGCPMNNKKTISKYAILVGPSGSTFVKEYDFFVSQGGTTEEWGNNWKIVEAESIEAARVIAIQQPGARAGLYCASCGSDRHGPCP